MYYQVFAGQGGAHFWLRNLNFFSYFTILSNLMAALLTGWTCLTHRLPSIVIRSAVLLYIGITGIVYAIVLRHIWVPQGMQWVADILLHYVTPLLYVGYWELFNTEGVLSRAFFWQVQGWPLGYLLYTLLKGWWLGSYPYPFLNVKQLGLWLVLRNALLICGLLAGLAWPVYLVNQFHHRSTKRRGAS